MPKKPETRIFITAIAIALTFTVNFSYGLTAKEAEAWKKDIDIYAGKISEFHIDSFHSLPKENFYNGITNLKKSLPEKTRKRFWLI